MKKFIQNRKGQKIAVVVDEIENSKELVFVMHGLGGSKDQPLIKTFAEAYLENGFTVVRFDTTNTFGESDGEYEDATVTNYYEDLEDVISWAKKQIWYREFFWLAGHSLGGICTALFAEKNSENVKALAPISTVVSNTLVSGAYTDEMLKKWKETGYRIMPRASMPGTFKKLKWGFYEDRMKYDLLENASKLVMPVLLVVGEYDESTPVNHQQIFFESLPYKKELHIIKGAEHTFASSEHLAEVKKILSEWIEKNKKIE
ncbi:MAG: hypothetical protein ACD_9C00208G0004 [uncultured bacterium]|nr:MAG: hypothetical protein ACD_9C00208G0004 [uncultured bacterium]